MEIRQLRYFIAVADTLNFSRAARSLFLSQSALSRQIMDLEQEVGVPLLIRSTREVELTEAGRTLQKRAKDLIYRWEKILPEVRSQGESEAQPLSLTIGADSRSMANPIRKRQLLSALFELRCKYPGLRLLLHNLDFQDLKHGLANRTLDCALVLDRDIGQNTDCELEQYAEEEMVLVFRSAEDHTGDDPGAVITQRGLVLVDKEPQGLYHIIHILSDLHLEPQIRFCDSLENMTMVMEMGESAAILPESVVVKLDNPELQVMRLPTGYAKLTYALMWAKGQSNPLLPEVREALQKIFA